MKKKSFIHFVCLIFISLLLFGCEETHEPTSPILGINVPIKSDGVLIQVDEARIQQQYSVHYIMFYAPPPYTFYKITLSIQGEMSEPHETLRWGEENVKLSNGEVVADLDHAVRILIGEDIIYKAGEDFKYRYVYFFKVRADSDYADYYLVLPDQQKIPLASIVQFSPNSVAQSLKEEPILGFIGGGEDNIASSGDSVVAGGEKNAATAIFTSIGGGYLNTSSVAYSTVAGGRENTAEHFYSTVGGGYGNLASGRDSTIGGGSRNTANFHHSTVGGGIQNLADASDVTISGGAYNKAYDPHATICGGTQNVANGTGATICGGAGNTTNANHSAIGGGLGNEITGNYAVIGGGQGNFAEGAFSVIPGGLTNRTYSDYSFASGHRSIIDREHIGAFLFADSTDVDFLSEEANEFAVRATGGVRFISAVGPEGSPISGVILSSGSGSWSTLSDKNRKENFSTINEMEILDLVVSLPISEWSYISEENSIHHIGPMAQDFFTAFGLGEDERYISSVDSDGVALAAIQGLNQLLEEKDAQIKEQQAQLDSLDARIIDLERQKTSFAPSWSIISLLAISQVYFARKLKLEEAS